MEYKVEHGDSIQKHILRDYIIKYSNLGTMNALSVRWSAAASKMEHSSPRCNLLDSHITTLQLSYLMPFLRQKSLAGYNHHPSQQPTLSLSTPGSGWLLLPLHHVPLSCMQLLALLPLPSISSHATSLSCSSLALIASLGEKEICSLWFSKYQ
jgi:hypothetical protein